MTGRRSVYRPMVRDGFALHMERKYGAPIEHIPGVVYAIHYEVPVMAKSVGREYTTSNWAEPPAHHPLRHYVGWTQQSDPYKRINQHHKAGEGEVVYLLPGYMQDEDTLKQMGKCPKCDEWFGASLGEGRWRTFPATLATHPHG
jgi:hypothetical protein